VTAWTYKNGMLWRDGSPRAHFQRPAGTNVAKSEVMMLGDEVAAALNAAHVGSDLRDNMIEALLVALNDVVNQPNESYYSIDFTRGRCLVASLLRPGERLPRG
jgi:hypothetical protein